MAVIVGMLLFLSPVVIALGINAEWAMPVGAILGFVLLSAWGKRCSEEWDRRMNPCPVCHGWSGAVILTEAPAALMCDRHRFVAGRIAFLEGQIFGEESR